MNNLEEIKFQNKFDYFAKMYGFIARSMMEAGGKRGERAVREAVIRYGRDLGEGIRKRIWNLGRKQIFIPCSKWSLAAVQTHALKETL